MVPQTPSRYYQASPAPEDGPRPNYARAAVGHIFELLVRWLVCFEARTLSGVPPEHSSTLGRSLGLTSAVKQNPPVKVISSTSSRRRVCGTVTAFHCERDVFSRIACAEGETRSPGETPGPSCSLYCSACASLAKRRPPAPAGANITARAWKSAQEPARRLRRRRAATDDGRAHEFRTASTHCRCCHR